MIPSPRELVADWWANSGYEETGYDDVFYHDVPPELAAEARRRERDEVARALREPWPLDGWPDTPTRYVSCAVTTGCFRRHGPAATRENALGSNLTSWTAAITSLSAAPASWRVGS
jgi:hypothetical protein